MVRVPTLLIISEINYLCDHECENGRSHHRYTSGCCCLPTPMTLASAGGGESDVPVCGPPSSLSVHMASSVVTRAGFVHKSRVDNVVRMWVQLKR